MRHGIKPTCNCQRFFSYNRFLCSVDILKNLGNGFVKIYEVKSSTSVEDIYYDGAPISVMCLQNLDIRLNGSALSTSIISTPDTANWTFSSCFVQRLSQTMPLTSCWRLLLTQSGLIRICSRQRNPSMILVNIALSQRTSTIMNNKERVDVINHIRKLHL